MSNTYNFNTGDGVFVLFDLYKELYKTIMPIIYAHLYMYKKDRTRNETLAKVMDGLKEGKQVFNSKTHTFYTVTHYDIHNQLRAVAYNIKSKEEFDELNTFLLDLQEKLKNKIKLPHPMLYVNNTTVKFELEATNDYKSIYLAVNVYSDDTVLLHVSNKQYALS